MLGKNSKCVYRVLQVLCPLMEVECVVHLIVCFCVTVKDAHILYTFMIEFWVEDSHAQSL